MVHPRTKLPFVAFLFALLLTGVIGCTDKTPIKVGFAGPLSEKFSDLGVQGRNGAQLAVETINLAGGVSGRPLVLIPADDLSTNEGAAKACQTLMEQDVVAILGHMTSSMTVAGFPVAQEAGTVMISPTTATPALTSKKDLFFRVIPDNSTLARGLAAHFRTTQHLQSVVTITDSDNLSFSHSFTEAYSDQLTALGGTVLDAITISSRSQPSWDSTLDRIQALDPDSIVVAISARDLAGLARAMRTRAMKQTLQSSMWGYTQEVLHAGGEAVNGILFGVAYSGELNTPAYNAFSKRYQDRFGWEPNFAAAMTYESVLLLAKALTLTAGNAQGLAEALPKTGTIEGVLGDFALDAYGDVNRSLYIVSIEDQQFVTLTTLDN